MAKLTPEEVAEWRRMMAQTTPTVVSPEAFAQLQEALAREPQVIPELEAFLREKPVFRSRDGEAR